MDQRDLSVAELVCRARGHVLDARAIVVATAPGVRDLNELGQWCEADFLLRDTTGGIEPVTVAAIIEVQRLAGGRQCEAIEVLEDQTKLLANATHDALSWAISDVRHGASAAVYEFVLEVAFTNPNLDATVVVSPWATARVELDNGSFAKLDVADRRLDSETALDNNIPPGFTVVRSFAGITQRGIVRGCEVEVEILGVAPAAQGSADAAPPSLAKPGPMTITIGMCDASE